MTPCGTQRVDLGSYAIGVLDDDDSMQLEAHLASCDECANELADLLPTAADLTTVDRETFVRTELVADLELPARRSSAAGRHPRNRGPRNRGLSRRLTGYLASREQHVPTRVLVVAALVVVGLVLVLIPYASGSHRPDLAGGAPTPRASASAGPTSGPSAAATPAKFQATDPSTGAQLELTVTDKRWGSRLALSLTHVNGPLRCRLVVVDTNGRSEVLSSWQVPWDGYGTPTHPAPLDLQTDTYLPLAGISRVEVQTVDQNDAGTRLVAVTPR